MTLIDLRSVEKFYGGLASHDRYLLDETVGEIAELEGGKMKLWPGNYSAYALARELALSASDSSTSPSGRR